MLLGLSNSSVVASSLESRSATRGIKCKTLKSCGGGGVVVLGFMLLNLLVDWNLAVSGKPAFIIPGIANKLLERTLGRSAQNKQRNVGLVTTQGQCFCSV